MIDENQPIINLKEAKRWIVRLWFVSCFVFQIMKLFGYRCSQLTKIIPYVRADGRSDCNRKSYY